MASGGTPAATRQRPAVNGGGVNAVFASDGGIGGSFFLGEMLEAAQRLRPMQRQMTAERIYRQCDWWRRGKWRLLAAEMADQRPHFPMRRLNGSATANATVGPVARRSFPVEVLAAMERYCQFD